MCRRLMRTGLARRHCSTSAAIERVVEEERGDTQLFGFELIEDVMRIISSIVVTHTGMIATDYEMRAAVILANQGMKDRFAWTGVAHRGRHDRKDRTIGRVVTGKNRFIRLQAHRRRHVVSFGF